MVIGRFIGWLLILAAAVVLLRDAIGWVDTHFFAPVSALQLWGDIDAASRGAVQAWVERSLPWLWNAVLATVLSWSAAAVLGLPGLVLVALCRRRGNGGRRRRRR